jgi:hypothetical protein
MLVSKDGKVAGNVEKELAKRVRLQKRATNKLFDERW